MAERFPSAWLDELFARADIVQVVSAYLPLKKDGHRYWGLCPFHNEKTASFSVNQELNLYHCFGCKAGGNVLQFLMEMERLTFAEAARMLAEQVRLPLPAMTYDPGYEQRQSQNQRLYEVNKAAAQHYHQLLWTDEGKQALSYLYGRGLDDGVIKRFGIGASSSQWRDLTDKLLADGFTLEELRLAGVTVVKEDNAFDMFRGRAIFPIINVRGQVLGFGGRAMGDAQPKYLNTADTPVFNKRMGVYAVNLLKKVRNLKRVLLVEGYMDVVALSQMGVVGVVATLGTALTAEQARAIKRYCDEVWVAYDGDSAGQHATLRALDIFEQAAIPARVLAIPDGLDPDEFIRERGRQAFDELKPLPATEYRMARVREEFDLATQEGRTEYAKRCAQLLQKVREPVELENYLQALMVQTGFTREVLIAQMGVKAPAAYEPSKKRERLTAKRELPGHRALRAEQTLLSLLAREVLPPGMVRAEDFTEDRLRAFAEEMLAGRKAGVVLNQYEDDAARTFLSEALSCADDADAKEAVTIAEDCLRSMRAERIQARIAAIMEDMRAPDAETPRDIAMKELMELTNELNRLKTRGADKKG